MIEGNFQPHPDDRPPRDKSGRKPVRVPDSPAGLLRGYAAPGITLGVFTALAIHVMLSLRGVATGAGGAELPPFWYGVAFLLSPIGLAIGIGMLFSRDYTRHRFSNAELVGWMLVGAGAFSAVEAVALHLVAGIHHFGHGSAQLRWDLAYLVLSVLVMVGGWLLARSAASRHANEPEVDSGGPMYPGGSGTNQNGKYPTTR